MANDKVVDNRRKSEKMEIEHVGFVVIEKSIKDATILWDIAGVYGARWNVRRKDVLINGNTDRENGNVD
jgi:hypothetical protein